MKQEFNPNVFKYLKERGFIHSMSHEDQIKKNLESGPVTFYLGIDPTADDMHIGHFFALQIFRILQDHGHNGILLIGNATAQIGDPSGKTDMRKTLSINDINNNVRGIESVLSRFIDLNETKIVHNADWIENKSYLNFMTTVGRHFNVADMLAKDCYKNRLGSGLTFLEMGYLLIQAFDFVHLNETYGCTLQIGGSDQWSNILAGVELGRKMSLANGSVRPELTAFCNPLLTNANGTKMGKTEKGTLWVSKDKTSAFDFYQYFYNIDDSNIRQLLLFFTDMPISEIDQAIATDVVATKKLMATKITQKIHGDFTLDAPEVEIELGVNQNTIVDVLLVLNLATSKREAREFLTAGAILIDNQKITDHAYVPPKQFVICKGKKVKLSVKIK